MGKQICFYASQKDVDALTEQIHRQGGLVVDTVGKPLSKDELQLISDYNYCKEYFGSNKFFVVKSNPSLHFDSDTVKRSIDEMKAKVIEFSLCTPSPTRVIDTSSVDDYFRKGGFVVITNSEEYNRQMDALMQNPVFVDNPNHVEHGFEHGRFWYSPDIYDDKGKVSKSKELDKLFSSLSRFIKNNFRRSKGRFAYIGPYAYEEYLQGLFVPCSGRNKILVE